MALTPTVADPRPEVDDAGRVLGARCSACSRAVARRTGRCERCGGELADAVFGPGGTVWSATTVHLPVGDRAAGFVLVSVDLDHHHNGQDHNDHDHNDQDHDGDGAAAGDVAGPRVLTRLESGHTEPAPGDRVRVIGRAGDATTDLLVTPAGEPSAGERPADAPTTTTPSTTANAVSTTNGDGRSTAPTAAPAGRAMVAGVGTSHFGRFPERRIEELGWEAIAEALADAELEPGQIDAAVVGSVFGPPGLANRVLAGAGLAGVPVFQVEAACASGTVAFHEAQQAVGSGRFDRVLAVGVEQLSTQFAGAIVPEPTDPDGRTGLAMPALYALQANRHRHIHDIDPELFAHVAVKNKRHGAGNPRAHLGDADMTLDRVLDSRPIAGPLTLLQCCPMTDGAAAAVVESDRSAHVRRAGRGIEIVASRFASGAPWGAHTSLPWGFDTVATTASLALADAGLTIDDIDLFEVHDAFTIGEILTLEAIGLCPAGRGAELAATGATAIGGPHPVNPSGGLLSRGHPLGATGLAQIAEAVWQLRGEADRRQVPGATTALVETMGGGAAGVDANACVVAVLRGPA